MFERICKVKIIPKSKRAKDRINSHGQVMWLKQEGHFQGEPAFHVESLEKTWRRNKDTKDHWGGWFTTNEADFEKV